LSTARKFASQTAIYGISTVFSRVLNFFLTPIYVQVYPVKAYGIFTTMYSWASMLNALLSFGMETTFFRYLNKEEHRKEEVYQNTFFFIFSLAVSFGLFALLFVGDIAAWMQRDTAYSNPDFGRYVQYFIYILMLDALSVIPFAKLRADGRAKRYGLLKFLNVLVFVSLNLFFIYGIPHIIQNQLPGAHFLESWFRPGWVGYVFLSNLFASAFVLMLLTPELLQLKLRINWRMIGQMLSYSWPVLIANISFIINENIDKVFLGRLLPEAISQQEVGIYGACCKLAIFLSIFIQAFRLGSEPFFFSHAKNANAKETYARIMHYFVLAVCIITLSLVANIELLKYFIKGHANQQALYWTGLKVVPVLLFAYVFLGVYMNLSIWYKLSDQTRYGLYISGLGALLTIGLNIWLIPHYSYVASAWITLLAYLSMSVFSYILGQKNYPIPYRLKRNTAYILLAVVLVWLSFTVFNMNIFIGNGLLLAYILVVYWFEQKEVRAILKRV